jgi:hypothetical protein
MRLPVPPAFRLERDTSPADWIIRRLRPWGKDRVRLWSFLPDAFAAYARVLHPAYRRAGDRSRIRWSELAARNGVTLGPASGFAHVSGIKPQEQGSWDEAVPVEGTLEREQVSALAAILAPFTQSADRCWLASWDGWGTWRPGSSATLSFAADPPRRRFGLRGRIDRSSRRSVDEAGRLDRFIDSIPKIEIPHRAYFLFAAHLADVPSFEVGGGHQAPSIWWPADRAWCVVTEVDGYSTYVGGTTQCVATLLASDDLEAIEVPPDVPMDPGPY